MIDIQGKKKKIISFLEINGPSLPIQIAKTIEMDIVFASAITSELVNSKQIKISHIKIGASPLYFLPGQEQKLEEYTDDLKSVEKNTFLKLKKTKIIIDEKEEPAIRVALRNIKDFAIPFKFQEKIMWKYAFTPDKEIEKLLSSPEKKPEIKKDALDSKKSTEQKTEKVSDEKSIPMNKKPEVEVNVPKAWETKKSLSVPHDLKHVKSQEITQPEKKSNSIENIFTLSEDENKKPEPKFLIEIKKFLNQKNIKFLEEVRTEKKEIMATISITSQLDNINFLLIAKNKKTITKDEIEAATQIATRNKMPCLLITRKQPSKSLRKLIDENHLVKIEIMK